MFMSITEPKLSSLCKTKMNPEKYKLLSETHAVEIRLSCYSFPTSSCKGSETRSSIFNLFFSQLIGLLLLLSRGNLVPAYNYAAHASLVRDVEVILVTSSFVGASVSLLLIGLMPRHVTIRRCSLRISFASLVAAVSILAYILFMEIFRRVSSGIKSGQLNEEGGDSLYYSYVFLVFRKICSASEEQQ